MFNNQVKLIIRLWKDFSVFHSVQTGSGVHSAPYAMGIGRNFPGVKRLWREAVNLPLSMAEVENCGAIPPLPQCLYA
jgi:hypothetical protein